MLKIIALISGNGTNLEALLECCQSKLVNAEVCLVISNNGEARGLEIAKRFNVPTNCVKEEFEISESMNQVPHDLIFCLGWMRILSSQFLKTHKNVINLHPSLSGHYVGVNAIQRAYNDYKLKKINYSGVMVHRVVSTVDAGEVLVRKVVKFQPDDTEESFTENMHLAEKEVVRRAVNIYHKRYHGFQGELLQSQYEFDDSIYNSKRQGKVRDIYDIGYGLIAFVHSDRLSAFDKYICDVPLKGQLLNHTNSWWLKQTKHIIPNHYVYHTNNLLIAKKCKPILLEVIVRGYITGNSKTSLWTLYQNDKHYVYGLTDSQIPKNLKKDQKLPNILVTPTTKDEHDMPLSPDDIVKGGYLSRAQWDYISKCAVRLYKYGAELARQQGLILVDTKYEFGFDMNGEITLMDEIHTCDSSRYWLLDEYQTCFENGTTQKNLDKDHIRRYIQKNYPAFVTNDDTNPPNIPEPEVYNVRNAYLTLYHKLSNDSRLSLTQIDYDSNSSLKSSLVSNYFRDYHDMVVILAGSVTDRPFVNKIKERLNSSNIYSQVHFYSAHRQTNEVMRILEHYNNFKEIDRKIVYVTVAGRSNALSGVVAANTQFPVFACPPFQDKLDMMVNINSTLQMPRNVPVMTVLDVDNLAISISRILQL